MRLVSTFSLVFLLGLAGCGSSSSSASPTPTSAPAGATSPGGQNHVHSILVLPHSPNSIYLGAHYRLYKSGNGGRTWTPLISQMMLSLSMDPANPSTIYAVSAKRGLMKTADGGLHWKVVTSVPPGQIAGVVVDPVNRSLFAYGVGIYRSTDGGTGWSRVRTDSITSLAVGSGRAVYAATGNGLLVSHDGGVRYKTVSSIGTQPVIQVAASSSTAYAVAAIGLFKTTDSGRTWIMMGKAPPGLEFIGVSPTNANVILGEVANSGFLASRDGGVTWHNANSGITDRNFNASTVRVAPSNPNIIYTGSWGLHFYASHDGGRHWARVSTLTH